ncbi:DUF2961 domain-containing protein [bacterium]|nr:DUF2961 domain-containing protein [bacterium]
MRTLFLSTLATFLMASGFATLLEEVTRPQPGRSMRFSTGLYDPESNADAYHIMGGQKLTFCELEGPGEVRRIWFTIMGDDRRYPRTLVMRWYWDDSEIPSVEAPIGDFFCAGNGMKANVSTLPIEVTSYGRALNCFWRMPFKKKARLELEHQGYGRLTVYCQVSWQKFDSLPDDTLYFHARYYQEAAPPPRFRPYTVADITGQGQMVGVVLSSQNTFESWFGEADDRYYIDGEEEPSLVGTGTEDYFTDAWNLRTFTNFNAGVTIKEPNAEDCRVTMYRWHLHEPITFQKSLKVEVERRSFLAYRDPATGRMISHDFKFRPDFWSSVAFWYQKGVCQSWPALAPASERIMPEVFLETADLAEAGKLRASEGCTPIKRSNRVCNKKEHMFMANTKVGSWLEVPCRIDNPGRYSISVYQSLFKDRGIWKVSLSGGSLAEPIILDASLDFFDPWLAWKENYPENEIYGTWREKKLGIHKLAAGDYTFRFECVGSHILSFDPRTNDRGYNLALDGISLRKMPIDDHEKWTREYLAEEEKLFAGMIQKAKDDVAALAKAIQAYKKDKGAYPDSLQQLLDGNYVKQIPRDPWNQNYQYVAPGRFNPHGFDVWSWHGNSRRSSEWIGNWTTPYRADNAIEGEDMKPAAGARSIAQEYNVRSIPPSSGGTHRLIRLRNPGDWAELALPQPMEPGRYNIDLCLVKSWDYGVVQFYLNGRKLGEPIDTWSKTADRIVVPLGAYDLTDKQHVLKVEALGKNEASQSYLCGLDAVIMTRIP